MQSLLSGDGEHFLRVTHLTPKTDAQAVRQPLTLSRASSRVSIQSMAIAERDCMPSP